MDDSTDYEIVSQKDLDELRKEISAIKKNPYGDTARGKSLLDAMERLENSINKLVKILEDAQTDIIQEYQESKPVEKLNQIMDQNETIARALLAINEEVKQTQEQLRRAVDQDAQFTASSMPAANKPESMIRPAQPIYPQPSFAPQQQFNQQAPLLQPFGGPQPSAFNQQRQSMQQPLPQSTPPNASPLDALPPLDDLPPLEGSSNLGDMNNPPQKKKFLGFM